MDPCVVAGNALSTSNPRPKHDLFTPSAALHLPQLFSFNSASHSHGNRQSRPSIARWGKGFIAGKTYALVLEWVPHPPASARLSRGRVWCAKLGLPLTSQQSLCRYIYLSQHPPWCSTPTRPLHHPLRAHWSWNISLPFIHHSRRSPRVRLAVLHVTTPSLPQRIERVWPANTRGHRRRLCLSDSYAYTHVFGARVLSAASPTRHWCTLF